MINGRDPNQVSYKVTTRRCASVHLDAVHGYRGEKFAGSKFLDTPTGGRQIVRGDVRKPSKKKAMHVHLVFYGRIESQRY